MGYIGGVRLGGFWDGFKVVGEKDSSWVGKGRAFRVGWSFKLVGEGGRRLEVSRGL